MLYVIPNPTNDARARARTTNQKCFSAIFPASCLVGKIREIVVLASVPLWISQKNYESSHRPIVPIVGLEPTSARPQHGLSNRLRPLTANVATLRRTSHVARKPPLPVQKGTNLKIEV